MASLRDIRKRIKSVKNTQKITKAMKMVSAAKLRRSQERMMATRPYAEHMNAVVAEVLSRELDGETLHALLKPRAAESKGTYEFLVLTSDRGLCGAFNSNITRRVLRERFDRRESPQAFRISTIGRKGAEAMKREKIDVRKNHVGLLEKVSFDSAIAIAQEYTDAYVKGEIDAVQIVYNEFVNAATQKVKIEQLLPIPTTTIEKPVAKSSALSASITSEKSSSEFEYEPSKPELLNTLLPRQLAMKIYRALLESVASEHAARMSAMDNASRNAKEMTDSLTLYYNRARQAAITKELLEIISGAESLKG